MPMEPKNYRDEIEQILKHFNGRHVLTFGEVQEYTGRGYKWCTAHLNIPHNGCTAVQLAKALCELK